MTQSLPETYIPFRSILGSQGGEYYNGQDTLGSTSVAPMTDGSMIVKDQFGKGDVYLNLVTSFSFGDFTNTYIQ